MKLSAAVTGVRRLLPKGDALPEATWRQRHRLVLVLLALAGVALPVFGVLRGHGVVHSVLEGAVVAGAAVTGAWARLPRRLRASIATVGLMLVAAIGVHFSGGTIEAHFAFFVFVGIITLYQDWVAFCVAIAFVVVHHGTVGVWDPGAVYNHPAAIRAPWTWAGVHGAFVLAASVAMLVFWRRNEDLRSVSEHYYRRLYEGERAVVAQLEETQRFKEELFGIVSHEFRTPLTAIVGFSDLLQRERDQLDTADVEEFLARIQTQAGRLRHLIENILTLERLQPADGEAGASLEQIVRQVEAETESAVVLNGERPLIEVEVDRELHPRMAREGLYLVISNLVGNAVKYAPARTRIRIRGHDRAGEMTLKVSNEAPWLDPADLERLFLPFVRMSGPRERTVSGVGLGLHIVRRVVDAHGGRIEASLRDGVLTMAVMLPAADREPSREAEPVPA
ncbi:MAG TPA: HAMP domain-containing sensor histidine kinase [Actinomycetota bacterium]|nr:HAMP domain-containing sensor histidine kinase [Actinomycetota bacterium]